MARWDHPWISEMEDLAAYENIARLFYRCNTEKMQKRILDILVQRGYTVEKRLDDYQIQKTTSLLDISILWDIEKGDDNATTRI